MSHREDFEDAVNSFTDDCDLEHEDVRGAYQGKKETLLIKRRQDQKNLAGGMLFTFMATVGLAVPAGDGVIDLVTTGGDLNELPYITAPLAAMFGYFTFYGIPKESRKIDKKVKEDVEKYKLALPKPDGTKSLPSPKFT